MNEPTNIQQDEPLSIAQDQLNANVGAGATSGGATSAAGAGGNLGVSGDASDSGAGASVQNPTDEFAVSQGTEAGLTTQNSEGAERPGATLPQQAGEPVMQPAPASQAVGEQELAGGTQGVAENAGDMGASVDAGAENAGDMGANVDAGAENAGASSQKFADAENRDMQSPSPQAGGESGEAQTIPQPVPTQEQTSEAQKIKKEKEQSKGEVSREDLEKSLSLLQDSILAANIPQFVMLSISYALDMRSSDIHIEPLENHVRLRYRIDGVLMHVVEYPLNIHPAVVSRVKIMSNLKIDEQRIPQDGRADVTTKEGREMDLRVSTLPTVNGEKIVMRIQDKSREIPDLPDLGIEGMSLRNLLEALDSPNGIIINTGPTGSGKTTTLYSCLARKNTMEVNILTIEDPVEIQLDGLNQSQVHHDIDYNFATGMRAALRQDPDIIMVGEIRDKETADTAIEASLTGHLVFSTLHTNSAVESITRLLNMGVPSYLLNSTIELIIAQRLVRRLCEFCKEEYAPDKELMEIVKKAMETLRVEGEIDPALVKNMKFFKPVGCEKCNKVGYKGRVGLYEVFRMNNDLRRLIAKNAPTLDIQEAAQNNGMVTLEQAGVIKALQGITSLDEVYRVARKSI